LKFARAALFLAAAALALVAHAQATDAPALWKVEGAKAPMFLFGSMHLLPPGVGWRTEAVWQALATTEVVVFETDIDALADGRRIGSLVRQHGLLREGRVLNDAIPDDTRRAFEAIATEFGLPPSGFASMRPWLAAVTLSMRFMARQGSETGLGVDQQLNEWARSQGRIRASLEPLESQVRMFADLPPDEEAEFLAVTLRQIRETPQILGDLLDAYRRGDLESLERTVNRGMDEFPGLRKRMLADRHERWLPQIERMMAEPRTHFIVVGAAHLAGPDSVVTMLRARGVRVERME
jgi:uncharacterized protein YbaP (TraB family)